MIPNSWSQKPVETTNFVSKLRINAPSQFRWWCPFTGSMWFLFHKIFISQNWVLWFASIWLDYNRARLKHTCYILYRSWHNFVFAVVSLDIYYRFSSLWTLLDFRKLKGSCPYDTVWSNFFDLLFQINLLDFQIIYGLIATKEFVSNLDIVTIIESLGCPWSWQICLWWFWSGLGSGFWVNLRFNSVK